MRKTFLGFIAGIVLTGLSGSALAQAFTENFDNITLLVGNGWFIQNNSSPLGSNTWFQGTPTTATPDPGPFNAFNGANNAYIGVNFASTTGGTGIISNWLVVPNRTLRNGDVFQFYTRKPTIGAGQTDFPDRLEVRLSTNGASANVGSTASGVGDFTTLLMSINPTLVTNVYPQTWTLFTITISGLPAPTSGRLAFRYFVTSAGPTGTNSDYIGIDNAVYTPYVCPSFTMTAGGALAAGTFGQSYGVSLSQTGALGAPNFAVTAGALPPGLALSASGSISGTAAAPGTFNFSVTVNDASGCSGSQAYSITIVPDVPGAPENANANAGDAQLNVTWNAPASDGGALITDYTATCTDGSNNFSGSALEPPITVTGLTNGTSYTCTVTATNSSGTGPASAPSSSVTPTGNQSITFDAQAGQTYSPGGSFAIDPPANASSGLAVSYGSSTTPVCTVSGTTVSIVAAGTCTLTADQAGDVAWNPAPQATQSLAIAQAGQSLTFPAQTVASHWIDAGSSFDIAPLASSAEPNAGEPIVYSSLDVGVCTVSGTTVTMVAVGACQIAADQAGNDNYTAAAQVSTQVMLVTPTEADLRIEKSVESPTARIGDTVVYSIVIGNDGPADATDVRVLDTPPARLDIATVVWECIEATGTACPVPNSDTGALDVTIPSLPEGATMRFELLGMVIPAAAPEDDFTQFHNTASIALPQGSGLTDPPANNESTIGVLVLPEAVFADGFETPPQP
jgi:uncharacterized repeat protein (TIGR01451 family)